MRAASSLRMIPVVLLVFAACATRPHERVATPVVAAGPEVKTVRLPKVIQLDKSLKPQGARDVTAVVKDRNGTVTDVRLKFLQVPIELNMANIALDTWKVELAPDQLAKLAVSGQVARYEAMVIARNDQGHLAVSRDPIMIAIKAPEAARPSG